MPETPIGYDIGFQISRDLKPKKGTLRVNCRERGGDWNMAYVFVNIILEMNNIAGQTEWILERERKSQIEEDHYNSLHVISQIKWLQEMDLYW